MLVIFLQTMGNNFVLTLVDQDMMGDVTTLLIPRLDQARGPCLWTCFKIYYAFFSLIILG